MASTSRNTVPVVNLSPKHHEELIVGFEEDARSIMDRLVAHRKQLDIISIVGMGGVGKTTLATKIFNDRYVVHHFYLRGWVTVSQAYTKPDLLKGLLRSIGKSVNEATTKPILCSMLYKSLKGMRYLIVIDDIWSVDAWNDLRRYLPDDNTSSRILITTRLTEVASYASPGGFMHNPRSLTEKESLELLCRKTFRVYECPRSFINAGKDIARKCRGLPLALVVIAGLLEKGEKNTDLWEKVAVGVTSYVIDGPNGCLDTLALSYDHLPRHLKNCFLYIGGFPKDYNIQVKRLIRLWMAEGFILEAGQRSLEEEAEDYVMDLVERNLLIVANKRSDGQIKSCRLHDLLRELCLKKATEENFFMKIRDPSLFNRDYNIEKQCRLFTDYRVLSKISSLDSVTHVKSVLCTSYKVPFNHRVGSRLLTDETRIWVGSFSVLRVLDMLNIQLTNCAALRELIQLWYLAVWTEYTDISLVVYNLSSLQTLLVKGIYEESWYSLYNMENLVNLRHLRADAFISVDSGGLQLLNLQSISRIRLSNLDLLRSFPNIKKLACCITLYLGKYESPNFSFLTHLEALNVQNDLLDPLHLEQPISFPETLKRLTLKGLHLPWSCMSTIQQLPNLEVLKLLGSSFKGRVWNMGDEQFRQQKFLKLDDLEIELWETSNNNFPRLRKLVIGSCRNLKEIPQEIGDISTLEHIEIDCSNFCLSESINRIQEEQHALGNDDIHVKIFDPRAPEVFFDRDPNFD